MILSANSPKSGVSSYDTSNIETISMALEEDPSSFWYSKTVGLTSCFNACGDSIGSSHDVVSKMQNISRPAISNTRVSPRKDLSHGRNRSINVKSSVTLSLKRDDCDYPYTIRFLVETSKLCSLLLTFFKVPKFSALTQIIFSTLCRAISRDTRCVR
ncbi:uncharacterized protein LOC143896178 [Temnothorax americanus]|uniref:uncharacterized protein LOC143896178 n=1 Tax=Temnothorax americanus TaxID=1964332 RepID=UPI0040696B6D